MLGWNSSSKHGHLTIANDNNTAKSALFTVSGSISNSGDYSTIPVVYSDAPSTTTTDVFSDQQNLVLSFTSIGQAGGAG